MRFATVGDDGTIYVTSGDDVILALDPAGSARYLTGGGPYVEGTTGGSTSFGDLQVVDQTLLVDTPDDLVEIDLSTS